MKFTNMRQELSVYYQTDGGVSRARAFAQKCFERLDAEFREGMSITDQKLLQYKVISEEFEPAIFKTSPFYNGKSRVVSSRKGA